MDYDRAQTTQLLECSFGATLAMLALEDDPRDFNNGRWSFVILKRDKERIMGFLKQLFSPGFMPHGYCYLCGARIMWLHVILDAFVTLIPVVLCKNRKLTFNLSFWIFGAPLRRSFAA